MIGIAALGLAACHESEVTVGELQEVMVLPAIQNRDIDILFVVDSSPSMSDQQRALVASFPQMMDALATLDGGLPNLHIGVVTTDMGTTTATGVGLAIPGSAGGCFGAGDDGVLRSGVVPELGSALYISDVANPDGTRARNYTGELRDVFSALATVGAEGCGYEQPFRAMRRALENPANAGFLRPEANLAVVILSDEDDCSAKAPSFFGSDTQTLGPLESFRCTRFGVTCDTGGTTEADMNMVGAKSDCHDNPTSAYVDDVGQYVDFLANLKGDPNRVMVAAIVGDPTQVSVALKPPPQATVPIPSLEPACSFEGPNGLEVADPAVRIGQLLAAFPSRSALTSICSQDLSLSLTSIGYAAKKLVGDPCLDVPVADTSAAEGIQPACDVVEGPLGAETRMAACDDTHSTDCWRLAPAPVECATADKLRLQIARAAAPTVQSYAHLSCLTR
ncbi:MAG: hypothetical protein HOV81_42660 [Kofleriaceae bacterium]|nr:hypothetical protein [Kofleriaceae bacterium]